MSLSPLISVTGVETRTQHAESLSLQIDPSDYTILLANIHLSAPNNTSERSFAWREVFLDCPFRRLDGNQLTPLGTTRL